MDTQGVLLILLVHYIADFHLQTDWMALNKSKRWDALLLHTSIYSVCFAWLGWEFVAITFAIHTIQDWFTSRLASWFWFLDPIEFHDPYGSFDPETLVVRNTGTRHWFFAVIGGDQYLHYLQLLLTVQFLNG